MLLAQAVCNVGTLTEGHWEEAAGTQYRLLATVTVQLHSTEHCRTADSTESWAP